MAGIGGVVVQFRADADKAIRETKKFVKELKDVDGASKKAGHSLKKGLGAAAVGVGAAVVGAGYALVQFGEAAVKDAAAQSRLKKTLENVTGATKDQTDAVEDWITQQGIALGVADDDLRPALARLVRSTEDVTKAQELAQIAMDISASTGKPLQGVADALAKAYDGNTGALKRMGIKLGEGKKGWEVLADSVKGSAESQANSVEGTWARVKLIFSEGTEALGGVVLAPLEKFADWLKDPKHITEVKDWLDGMAKAAYEAGQEFVAWIESTVVPAIEKVVDYFGSAKGKAQIQAWVDAFRSIAGAIQAVIDKLDVFFNLLDKLPSNVILQKLGLIPKLSDLTSGDTGAVATKDSVRKGASDAYQRDKGRRTSDSATRSQLPAGVSITIVNGKQEKIDDAAALALRIARKAAF